MSRKGTYAKGLAKQEEILDAALSITAQKGFRETSIQDIANAVSLSQPGVLHHFQSRDNLFLEVLRRHDQRLLDLYPTQPDLQAVDPVDPVDPANLVEHKGPNLEFFDFAQGLAEVMRLNANTPGFVEIFSNMSIAAADPAHAAHSFFIERREIVRNEYAKYLAHMQEHGSLVASVDVKMLAVGLHALADGLQLLWLNEPELDMGDVVVRLMGLLNPLSLENATNGKQ